MQELLCVQGSYILGLVLLRTLTSTGASVVAALGADVTNGQPGDRVLVSHLYF